MKYISMILSIFCVVGNLNISRLMAETNKHHEDISNNFVYANNISGLESKNLRLLKNPEIFFAGEALKISDAIKLPPVYKGKVDFEANNYWSKDRPDLNGECVTYVKNARKELVYKWGYEPNGEYRESRAKDEGFEVNNLPRVGAAFIVKDPGKKIDGHTGLVKDIKINKNGEYVIHIIESNLKKDGKIRAREVKYNDIKEKWVFIHEKKNEYDKIVSNYLKDQKNNVISALASYNKKSKPGYSNDITKFDAFVSGGSKKTLVKITKNNKDFVVGGEFEKSSYLKYWDNHNAKSGYSSFGEIKPIKYSEDKRFGFIHTGYGAENNRGYISQNIIPYKSTNATFTARYNFVTTEFPDFLGSQFNDSFVIKIQDVSSGKTKTLVSFEGSLNELFDWNDPVVQDLPSNYLDNAEWGGGQTGWTIKSQKVYLKSGGKYKIYADVRDVGDRIFDSALLIDKISLR